MNFHKVNPLKILLKVIYSSNSGTGTESIWETGKGKISTKFSVNV